MVKGIIALTTFSGQDRLQHDSSVSPMLDKEYSTGTCISIKKNFDFEERVDIWLLDHVMVNDAVASIWQVYI